MHYRITIRYGDGEGRQRYHLETLEAPDLAEALRVLAGRLPEDVATRGDLVELRPDVDPEARPYLGEREPAAAPDEPPAEAPQEGDPPHG